MQAQSWVWTCLDQITDRFDVALLVCLENFTDFTDLDPGAIEQSDAQTSHRWVDFAQSETRGQEQHKKIADVKYDNTYIYIYSIYLFIIQRSSSYVASRLGAHIRRICALSFSFRCQNTGGSMWFIVHLKANISTAGDGGLSWRLVQVHGLFIIMIYCVYVYMYYIYKYIYICTCIHMSVWLCVSIYLSDILHICIYIYI